MKICIICPDERNYLPHLAKYTEFFDKNAVSYDVIFWYHDEAPQMNSVENSNEYNFYQKSRDGFWGRIRNAIAFRSFALDVLEKNSYDKLVILNTRPALLLKRTLYSRFKNQYLLDYRGYTFEGMPIFKGIVDKLIENSSFTAISSHGFMDFLSGSKKIIVNHNISSTFAQGKAQELKGESVINIGFIGKLKYYDENCALVLKLKNEFRYQLWYLGKPVVENSIEAFCKTNEVTNVSYVGQKYINEQKAELYKNMDMINAVFGDESLEKRTLLPTRLYDACLLRKPIIASRGTFLGEVIERYNLGLTIDVDEDDVLTLINDYIETFNIDEFELGCSEFLSDVQHDEDTLLSCLRQFTKDKRAKKKHK